VGGSRSEAIAMTEPGHRCPALMIRSLAAPPALDEKQQSRFAWKATIRSATARAMPELPALSELG